MTVEEFNNIVSTITPDSAQSVAVSLSEAFADKQNEVDTAIQTISEKNTEIGRLNTRIKDLQDTNMKLFTRVTAPSKDKITEDDVIKTPEEIAKEMFNSAY